MTRLQQFYKEKVVPELIQRFGYRSVMEVPRLRKITLNMGLGDAVTDKKIIENAVADLTRIAGQKPVVTRARRAISGFKIRQGYPIGAMVTLRGRRMFEFLDRLINVALPRVRDFRGVSPRAFDAHGTITWASGSRLFSLRLTTTKLINYAAWISISVSTRKASKKRKRF